MRRLKKRVAPVVGGRFLYIYCLWVSGSFKGKGHGKALLEYCIDDAKKRGKSGVCAISSKEKKPFLSEKKFMQKFGFETVDTIAMNMNFWRSHSMEKDRTSLKQQEGKALRVPH
jgi:N-acetylglutamate synthase-like GNAT family acetyltransferase